MRHCLPALLLLFALPALAQPTPAVLYADRLLATLPTLVAQLPGYAQAAEAAAQTWAAGGKLWLAGDRGFVLEAAGRAGGLMTARQLAKPEDVKPGDVVLFGSFSTPDQTQLETLRQRGGHVVVMTPTGVLSPGSGFVFDPRLAPGTDPTLAAPVLVASLWTFTGELVSALTRLGKLPPLYQSVLVPGGRERNAAHAQLQWEPGPVSPVPALWLGRQYLSEIANDLRSLRTTQAGKFTEAGQLAAETRQAGHTVWYASLGHLPPELPGLPGDPQAARPMSIGALPDKLAQEARPGDLILYVGYYEPYGPWVEKAHEAGVRIVTVVSGTPERAAEAMGADLNISACWPFGDTAVGIPGYDVRFLPPSGFMAAAAYYMLMAEAKP